MVKEVRAKCDICKKEFKLTMDELFHLKFMDSFICKVCKSQEAYKGNKKVR